MSLPVPADGDVQQHGIGAKKPTPEPAKALPDERDWITLPGHPDFEQHRITKTVRLKPGSL